MKRIRIIAACAIALGGLVTQSFGQQVAGTLQVNLDATALSTGPIHYITNAADLGGVFQAGATGGDPEVIALGGNGTHALMFNGAAFMQHLTALDGGAYVPAANLLGTAPTFSVEAWTYQTTIEDDASVLSWGIRGNCGGQVSCSYGRNGSWGGFAMWCNDQGWPTPPAARAWHHLVWTLAGSTVTLYADGVQVKQQGGLTPNVNPNGNILLAVEHENTSGGLNVFTTLLIGRVRIHSGVLTPAQVTANYNLEVASFTNGTPVNLVNKPTHRYSFNNAAGDATGATVSDTGTIGGKDATVLNGTGSATFSGSVLSLSGGDQASAPYVDLPNYMLSSLSANSNSTGQVSFEGWVKQTGDQTWCRYFDFGSSGSVGGELTGPGGAGEGFAYFMLCAEPGNDLEHAVQGFKDAGLTFGSHTISTPLHFVATWDEASGVIRIYQNGSEVAAYTVSHKFYDIVDVNCWLGRSNWPDRNFQGDYDEFRIYTNILSAGEVLNNYIAGPDTLLVAPGPLQAVRVSLPRAQMMAGTFQQATVYGDFQNVTNVNITGNAGLVIASDNTAAAIVSASGLVTAVGTGTAHISATYQTKSGSQPVTVVPITSTLIHRYSFNTDGTDLTDSVGGAAWDGTSINGAYTTAGQIIFDSAVPSYAQLPVGIITNHDAITVEAWASFGANGNWNRLFDFGDQNSGGAGRYYLGFIPHSGGNDVRLALSDADPGGSHEQDAFCGPVLDNQTNVHVVAVVNPFAGYEKVYLNGLLAGQNTNVTIPLSGVHDLINYLGHSLYNGDAFMQGSIDEFRIYDGVLTPDKIAVDTAAGPDQLVTNPGALQTVHLTAGTTMFLNGTEQAQFMGNFANQANVNLIAFGGATFTSGNTGILTVSSSGLVTAVGLGSTTITAQSGLLSDQVTITVQPRPLTLIHRYTFNTDFSDTVGGADWTATPAGSATLSGGQVVLNPATQDHVQLPANVISNLQALTIEAWASFGTLGNWCRLWDIGDINGTSGQNYMLLSPHPGDGFTFFQIRPTGVGADETVSYRQTLDNKTNVHVVATIYPAVGSMKLYLNDFLVAENTAAFTPLSAVHDNFTYLGRSLFSSDAYLNGSINEFRVYDGVMNPQQVAVDGAAGPDRLVTSPGSLLAVHFTVANTNMLADQSQQALLTGDFANVSGVNLFAYGSPSPTLTCSDTNVVLVNASGLVTAVGKGTATLTANYNSVNYTLLIHVDVTPLILSHRYSFSDAVGSTNVIDSVGAANGVIFNNGVFNGTGQLALDGTNSYVELPARIISALSNLTIEAWVTPTNLTTWQRIVDFGSSDMGPGQSGTGTNYIFLAASPLRFTTKVSNDIGEVPVIDDPSPLINNQLAQVVGVYNVSAGLATLYVNGQKVGSGGIVMPLNQLNDENVWLGRSQWNDPYFAGYYDDVRLWEGALTAGEVKASYAAGPNSLPLPAMRITTSGNSLTISWPEWGSRYSLYKASALGTGWVPAGVTPVSDGISLRVTIPASGAAGFYRLAP